MSPYLNALNTDYIEHLAEQYRKDPDSLDNSWRYFFEGMEINPSAAAKPEGVAIAPQDLEFEVKVLQLIQGYREMGYLVADVDPLTRGVQTHPLLTLQHFGLHEEDLDRVAQVGRVLGFGAMTLREIIRNLTYFYCSPVAVEYGHIDDPKSRDWIQKRVESNTLAKPLHLEMKLRILKKLVEAESLETFLHKRFVGQKRFSVEGIDVIIPMLDHLIEQASLLGADEILLGMAHRGRLNVLANVFYKDLNVTLGEFSGNFNANVGDGDVKYHMGFSQNIITSGGKAVHLSLLPNPSHLEAVNSVLMGVARSKQKMKGDKDRTRTLGVLLHGDVSFSGQGSVYELLNMSELAGYTVGGMVHIILNNQVGFTTSPKEARSTPNATDVAKMLEIPIFRVNADEPESAIRCTSLALQFRYKFKRDVVIDLMGYRRYGHNEGDEPSFTQPLMYQKVKDHPRVLDIYTQSLKLNNLIEEDAVKKQIEEYHAKLEDALTVAKNFIVSPMMHSFGDRWSSLHKVTEKNIFHPAKTGVKLDQLHSIGSQLMLTPKDFHLHPKVERLLADRREMLEGKRPVDWGLGESLAFSTLVFDGHPVRLAGQDSERGTFSHRHAVFHDVENGKKYNPYNHIFGAKADFEVVNSLLSEYAAMGFEYGQSVTNPKKLTIWEAQFGDFVNGAQIILDQFLACSAFKWQRFSGLTLFLPHGYEGQGPEHSSGRLERFLTACAQNNIQVCNFTTPAQLFHALRRQVMRDFRLPLVIMTPKSLLRSPLAVSPLSEFQDGRFHEVIDDPDPELKKTAKRVIFCSGKIYYELWEARRQGKHPNIALVRLEQFYPFPAQQLGELLAAYSKASQIVWCQEGPQNSEGWAFIYQYLTPLLSAKQHLIYAGRGPQASPADGYLHLHLREQKRVVNMALGN